MGKKGENVKSLLDTQGNLHQALVNRANLHDSGAVFADSVLIAITLGTKL
jgi:hypothetical protein